MKGGSPTPLFSIRELRTWFETPRGMVRAVDGVSLDLPAGGSLGVVGESGSGKTQSFFSVFGLTDGYPGVVGGAARFEEVELLEGLEAHVRVTERPGDGAHPDVHMREHRWRRAHQARARKVLGHRVAFIFQEVRRSLIPYWTVRRHLREVLLRRGRPVTDAAGLLARLGFRSPGRILEAFPDELSGGEAQRAMLALAMAMEPRLLIADEPTTALDAISQSRLLGELQRVHHELGLALVLISHDLAVVNLLVDHVAVLFRGRIVERLSRQRLEGAAPDELHPYTLELRESQGRRRRSLTPAPPLAARPELPSSGCPYAGRCALRPRLDSVARERCHLQAPPLRPLVPGHEVACWGLVS